MPVERDWSLPLSPEEVQAISEDEIDDALENDLPCPYCGGRNFNTGQLGIGAMTCVDGNWGTLEDPADTETVSVTCDDCEDRLIWAAPRSSEPKDSKEVS